MRKNGIRDITLASGSGRGVQIFDRFTGENLVATMYRNDENNNGAIQLKNGGGYETFFYVGMGETNYKMQFAKWSWYSLGADETSLYVHDKILLHSLNGVRKGYFDQLNVGGSTMTSLAWKWSSELGAFVLTGTQ